MVQSMVGEGWWGLGCAMESQRHTKRLPGASAELPSRAPMHCAEEVPSSLCKIGQVPDWMLMASCHRRPRVHVCVCARACMCATHPE